MPSITVEYNSSDLYLIFTFDLQSDNHHENPPCTFLKDLINIHVDKQWLKKLIYVAANNVSDKLKTLEQTEQKIIIVHPFVKLSRKR